MPLANAESRLLVVGWRDADWPALHHWIEAGRMPHLRRLVERGSMASLTAPLPLHDHALWTSLATSMRADRHGVTHHQEVRPDGGGLQPVGRRAWRVPAFWEAVQAAGHATICLNWPATAPADRWPGRHVDESFKVARGADIDLWPIPLHSVSPRPWRHDLAGLRVHPADDLDAQMAALVPELAQIDPLAEEWPASLRRLLAQTATVHALATDAVARDNWRLLCVCYDLLAVRRSLGGVAQAPPHTPPWRARNVESGAAMLLDMMLGRLVELAGPRTTVLLVSPTGVAPLPSLKFRLRPQGVLVAHGPGIATDALLAGVSVLDVAPSILARFGLQVPSDGRVVPGLVPNMVACVAAPVPALAAPAPIVPVTPEAAIAIRAAEADRLCIRAQALEARGAMDQAEATLRAALDLRPDDIAALTRLAQYRALHGDLAAALAIGAQLMAQSDTRLEGPLVLGAAQALTGQAEPAAAFLRLARERAADAPESLVQIGGVLLLIGQDNASEAVFTQALALEPALPGAQYGRGVALRRLGQRAASETALRAAIALAPHHGPAMTELATLLMQTERWHEAVQVAGRAVEEQPASREALDALTKARQGLAAAVIQAIPGLD